MSLWEHFSVSVSLILDIESQSLFLVLMLLLFLFFPFCLSINLPPLFDGQQQTKADVNNSKNKHERKEENNMANKLNEVSFIS